MARSRVVMFGLGDLEMFGLDGAGPGGSGVDSLV